MTAALMTASLVVDVLRASAVSLAAQPQDDAEHGERVVPRDLRQWLARLRLLEGVPFAYLAPDSALLPPESIRFFYVDRNWTDALVQGALSVGTVNSSDRAQLEQLHPAVRAELDEEERGVRRRPGDPPQRGPGGLITGFLLRSRAVSGWPGMHVRAYTREVGADTEIVPETHPSRLRVLRLERLAPAVLLVLFDGVPAVVHLEEPRQGVQFGVRLTAQANGTYSASVPARDVTTSETVRPSGPASELPVSVHFRPGAPGVLDLRRTRKAFADTPQTKVGATAADVDSAEFALEMIRFPYRQVFGDPGAGGGGGGPMRDVFRPSVAYTLSALRQTFLEAPR